MSIDEDPITTASAGLRALGVAPQRRIETLGLLSALIDLADERGEVLLDTALMEAEERLGIDACLEGYEWLERLDVIRRTWSGWVIQDFASHHGPVGMTEASFAVLQRHMTSVEGAPTAVVPAVPSAAPVVTLKTWRRRVPVIAASVAAGVVALAGATQFVPQAAVTGRNAAARRSESTAAVPALVAPTLPATTTAAGVATTAVSNAVTDSTTGEVTSTTTSTTLLPALPCVSDVLRDLGGRAGLQTTQTTQSAPSVLPCP